MRQTVSNAGVQNVEVVAETEAAAALARSVGADAALLLADDDTVALTVVGEDEESTSVLASVPIGSAGAAVACAAVLQQVPEATTRVMLVGQRLDLDSVAAELSSTTAGGGAAGSGLRDRPRCRADGRSILVSPRRARRRRWRRLLPTRRSWRRPLRTRRRWRRPLRRDADGAGCGRDADGTGFGRA